MVDKLSFDELRGALLLDRLSSYVRLWGGFPIPLAGAIYWAVLGIAGYFMSLADWAMLAFVSSGLIFPLALLLARIFKNSFMKDKSIVGTVLPPAFISMLLFWAIMIPAIKTAPELTPLILAIGMSGHWPVIGWSYGRTALFSAHAILRALIVVWLWFQFPEHSLTWLPLSVMAIYLVTVAAIIIDVRRLRKNSRFTLHQRISS